MHLRPRWLAGLFQGATIMSSLSIGAGNRSLLLPAQHQPLIDESARDLLCLLRDNPVRAAVTLASWLTHLSVDLNDLATQLDQQEPQLEACSRTQELAKRVDALRTCIPFQPSICTQLDFASLPLARVRVDAEMPERRDLSTGLRLASSGLMAAIPLPSPLLGSMGAEPRFEDLLDVPAVLLLAKSPLKQRQAEGGNEDQNAPSGETTGPVEIGPVEVHGVPENAVNVPAGEDGQPLAGRQREVLQALRGLGP